MMMMKSFANLVCESLQNSEKQSKTFKKKGNLGEGINIQISGERGQTIKMEWKTGSFG